MEIASQYRFYPLHPGFVILPIRQKRDEVVLVSVQEKYLFLAASWVLHSERVKLVLRTRFAGVMLPNANLGLAWWPSRNPAAVIVYVCKQTGTIVNSET